MDEDTGGIIIAAEERGGTKKECFTRFVARLLLLDSGASCWGVSGVDVGRDGICKVGSGPTGVAA
jgi:hypothetical protein